MTEDAITDAGGGGLHYEVNEIRGLNLYHGRDSVLIGTKSHHLVSIANDCMTGVLRINVNGEPVEIVDHPWLLRLASRCCDVAAQLMERN